MQTTIALVVKFAITFLAAVLSFYLLDNNTMGWVAIVALAGTALNYLLGDLVVLPRMGNITASVGDGLMGAIIAYAFTFIVPAFRVSWASLLLFAVLIVVAEYAFHMYLKRSEKVAP